MKLKITNLRHKNMIIKVKAKRKVQIKLVIFLKIRKMMMSNKKVNYKVNLKIQRNHLRELQI